MVPTGQRLRKNAWGPYYVTDACDGCGVCRSYAPCNFESSYDGTYCYLIQQPYDDWEEQAILDAMLACPVAAIRDDGERDVAGSCAPGPTPLVSRTPAPPRR